MSKKILVIEDDSWFNDVLCTTLKSSGYQTKSAAHAIEAISAIDEFHPDVIVSDILLTGSTAFNLFNELQSHDDLSQIPIIICSNLGAQLETEQLSSYGVKAVLDKPIMRPADLLEVINGCFNI